MGHIVGFRFTNERKNTFIDRLRRGKFLAVFFCKPIDNCYKLLYTVIHKEVADNMHIIINPSSMVPIYEQIVDAVKTLIRRGTLAENDCLPSVRTLSAELRISALTVKKAYDALEGEGFVVTVHGKGTYVAAVETALLLEEQRKELEGELTRVIQKGRRMGIPDGDMRTLFEFLLEDEI